MISKIIDLSHTISEDMTIYPGSEKPSLLNIATIIENGFNELEINISTHTGTHVDAPAHILSDGKTLDQYSIKSFFGKGLVIDCTNSNSIEKSVIKNSIANKIEPDFLIFRTGWDRYWNNNNYFNNYPILTYEAAEFISNLSLSGVGIDAPSFDHFNSVELPNHNTLLRSGFILIENLCNLSLLPEDVILFSFLPLKIKDTDGSPIRAIAILE